MSGNDDTDRQKESKYSSNIIQKEADKIKSFTADQMVLGRQKAVIIVYIDFPQKACIIL